MQLNKISNREREVLYLIAYEHSASEIASKLHISANTVNSHRKNLQAKLNVRSIAGLVRVSIKNGLVVAS